MKHNIHSGTACYYEMPPYCNILSAIGEGAANARQRSELLKITGMQDRELRKTIEFLRRQGVVIISDEHGYFFPADEAELRSYITQESRRAESVTYTLNSAKELLRQIKEDQ